jgi:hypothetical protein
MIYISEDGADYFLLPQRLDPIVKMVPSDELSHFHSLCLHL